MPAACFAERPVCANRIKKLMMKIVFATNNKNKINELTQLIGHKINLCGLSDIGCEEELPETQDTIEGNALQKAKYVYDNYGHDCFADDTGLEVSALNGRPGVYSARYAGEGKSAEDNMQKLLEEMKGAQDRSARFKTVIALVVGGKKHLFEGIVNGRILEEKRGEKGFGYDPVFVPDGYEQAFAEMSMELKNEISHRGIAVRKLVEYLNSSSDD
jgi:XTP/dITP diphosphohydrolase